MRARFVYVFLTLAALAFPVLAEDRRGGASLDRALSEVRRNVPGRFYDADGPYMGADGRMTYRVKWMTPDGRIVWFNVDGRSGQILGGMPARGNARFRDDWNDRPDWRDRGNFRGDDRGWGDHGGDHGGDRGWGGDRGRGWGHGNGGGGWGNDRGGGHGGGHNDGGHDGGGRDRRHGG